MNIATYELHTIALLCANPDNPESRDHLAKLGPIARAVAASLMQKLWPGTSTVNFTNRNSKYPPEMDREIHQAVDELSRFLLGRKSEEAVRVEGMISDALVASR